MFIIHQLSPARSSHTTNAVSITTTKIIGMVQSPSFLELPGVCAHTGRLTSAMPGLIGLKKPTPARPLSTIFAAYERRHRKGVSRRITEIFGKQVCLYSAVYLYIEWPPRRVCHNDNSLGTPGIHTRLRLYPNLMSRYRYRYCLDSARPYLLRSSYEERPVCRHRRVFRGMRAVGTSFALLRLSNYRDEVRPGLGVY